jgi:hypothetical protein
MNFVIVILFILALFAGYFIWNSMKKKTNAAGRIYLGTLPEGRAQD